MENHHVHIAGRQKEIIKEIENLKIENLSVVGWFFRCKICKPLVTEWIVNDMVEGLHHSEHFNVKTLEDAYRIISREKEFENKLIECDFEHILKKSIIKLETVFPEQMKNLGAFNNQGLRYSILILILSHFLSLTIRWFELSESHQLLEVLVAVNVATFSVAGVLMLIFSREHNRALRKMFMKTTRIYARTALIEDFFKQ